MNLVTKETGTFRSFDGTRIYYEVRGQGEPLILNYGIGCLMNHWRHQVRHFSQNHQVITYDYRAHHRSAIPESRERLNMDAMVEDLKCLMDHLQIPSAGLWGHSFGVELLLRMFSLYPHMCKHLIFINGFAKNPLAGMFGSDVTSSFFQLFKSGYQFLPETLSYVWRLAVQNPLAVHASALAGGFNLKLTSLKDIEIYARGIAAMDLSAFITMFQSMIDYDGTDILETINVPTLIIGGKQDSVTPQKHQQEMHRKIPKSEFMMVPYGSHCTQLDMPDLVNLRIEKFLSRIEKNEPAEKRAPKLYN